MAATYTLGKNERLKSRKQLEKLFAEGQAFSVPPFRVVHQLAEGPGQTVKLKFGVGVSARHFKKAVHRNRIKRLIRESWRVKKMDLASRLEAAGLYLDVFIIFTGREMTDFASVQDTMDKSLKRLTKLLFETKP